MGQMHVGRILGIAVGRVLVSEKTTYPMDVSTIRMRTESLHPKPKSLQHSALTFAIGGAIARTIRRHTLDKARGAGRSAEADRRFGSEDTRKEFVASISRQRHFHVSTGRLSQAIRGNCRAIGKRFINVPGQCVKQTRRRRIDGKLVVLAAQMLCACRAWGVSS